MKAQLLRRQAPIESKPLQSEELPLPDLSSPELALDGLLIRVLACAVCLTDLHIIEGDLPLHQNPTIPGHQVVGIVEDRGRDVTRFQVGDHVGVIWLHHSCGGCDYCSHEKENLCEQATFTGWDHFGGYAEYTTVSEAYAVALPQDRDPALLAPLLCAGVVGYRSYKLSQIVPGGRLALFGFGAAAHLMIQVARFHRCEVYVCTRNAAHQQLARDLGATWVGRAEELPPATADSAIIFAPSSELLPYALAGLKRGGTLAFNAIHAGPIHLPYEALYNEKVLRTVSHSTREDADQFLSLAATIPITPQVTTFPLSAANEALQLLKQSKIAGSAVLIP